MKKILFDDLSFILNDEEKEQFEEENGYNYGWVEELLRIYLIGRVLQENVKYSKNYL